MKFRVSMKDPDSLADAIDTAVGESVAPLSNDADERQAAEARRGDGTKHGIEYAEVESLCCLPRRLPEGA